MKIKFTIAVCLLLVVLFGINYSVKSNIYGAPTGRTGAPQNYGYTCYDNCHNSYTLNDTTKGKITIQLMDSLTPVKSYTPGKSYKIKITQTKKGCTVMGFEATVYKGYTNTHIGALSTGGDQNIQVYSLHATHTWAGTAIATTGKGSWSVPWKAPAAGTGAVNIYAATNAADGDGTNAGDYIFNDSLILSEVVSGINEAEKVISGLNIYPNPASKFINLNYSLPSSENLEIELCNIYGNTLQKLFYGQRPAGENSLHIDLDNFSTGIYLIRMTTHGSSVYRKIFIQS